MKRLLCAVLSGLLLLGLFAGCATEKKEEEKKVNQLHGKRIIFIGNSHIFKGGVVNYLGNEVVKQEIRQDDVGLFHLLCKENGARVSVTNWTFSGHGLQSLFGQPCTMESTPCSGKSHEEFLLNRYYDYVVVSPGVSMNSARLLPENTAYIKDFFLKENPNAKFILLGNASVYGHNKDSTPYPGITGYYKTLEEQGWLIADWGRVVSDLITGQAAVPGTQEVFNKNSFIIKDGFHPNLLSGYIASVMTYCAITGEPATTLAPDFFSSTSAFKVMIANQLSESYTYGERDTNFHKVLLSDTEMSGILQLIDQQLAQKPYRQNEMP